MIPVTTFAGSRLAVFGLGASGIAAAKALLAGGAEVWAWDDTPTSREGAVSAGIPLVDLAAADWAGFAALILAPGVPLTHPAPHWSVLKARAAGVEVIGDIELFFRERAVHCPAAPVIAITGTNGKSTTTALITHILRSAGLDAQMGGNIGRPILDLEPPAAVDRIHVIEMSSFQIDLTPSLAPTIGVLLNLTPDHLDRHGPADDPDLAMRNYAAIKARLVAAANRAIVSVDDQPCAQVRDRLGARRRRSLPMSIEPLTDGICLDDTRIVLRMAAIELEEPVAEIAGIPTLRGIHNAQNAMAAAAAVKLVGAAIEDASGALLKGRLADIRTAIRQVDMTAAMRSYPGLPHRMEEVGRRGRVVFVNDSKATNADSTEKALASWDRDIFWILGGKPKEGGIAALSPHFPRVAKAYLIGQAADEFAVTLDGYVPFEKCGTLDAALLAATRDASASSAAEPVVLLSPACASYDQFKSFEQRGDTFRRLVQEPCRAGAP